MLFTFTTASHSYTFSKLSSSVSSEISVGNFVSGPSTGILVAKTKKKYCKFKTITLRIIDRIKSFKRNRNNPERNEANN